MYYWRFRFFGNSIHYSYFKTERKFISKMVIEIAVKRKELIDVFAEKVDEVIEVSEQEYYTHMWE